MLESKHSIDLLGSIIANVNNILLIGIFLARIYKYSKIENWLGIIFILSIIPLTLMLLESFAFSREGLYYVQLILMMSFIVLELILDYLLKIDFRQNRSVLIPYVTLFYASFGGMIGIASHSGKQWTIITVITFLLMAAASLIMHFKTDS
jgi:hypothetical protein